MLQTPESFNARFNVNVKVKHEVLSIDRSSQTISVKNLITNDIINEHYDKLILSPGAEPFVPPFEEMNDEIFMTLRNIPDLDKIKSFIEKKSVKKAVVIGGGFIGIEVSENLIDLGIDVHLVELAPQVLGHLDMEMANIVHAKLRKKGMKLHLGKSIKKVCGNKAYLSSGEDLDTDIVISAIGVVPETTLAKQAGLPLGKTGGILVDKYMRTEDPNVYAVGDAIEVLHFVTTAPSLIPLAGPANKQGRIAASHITGRKDEYKNTMGTGILKVFDLQVASTGISERWAKRGNVSYKAIHLHPNQHVNYYPGAAQMALKVLYDPSTGKILGAQGVGAEGVDKRIDVLATAMRGNMTIFDLEELELSYAPPFGSAKDPVNMAGYVADNIRSGLVNSITYDELRDMDNPYIVDVRTEDEVAGGIIEGASHINVDHLREKMIDLPKDRDIVIYCRVGIRGYIASRLLSQHGFDRVYNLSGGYLSYLGYEDKVCAD